MSREISILAERRRAAAARARETRARQRELGRPDDRVVDAAMAFAVGAQIGRVVFSGADRSVKAAALDLAMLNYSDAIRDAVSWMVRRGHDETMSRTALVDRISDRSREWRDNWQGREQLGRDA